MGYSEELAIEKRPKMRCNWASKSPSYFLAGSLTSLFTMRDSVVNGGNTMRPRIPRRVMFERDLSGLEMRTAPFVPLLLILCGLNVSVAAELQPLRYNHPGLTVDLGVGLWAWPIPCDADGDGDYDLIVSCPDQPSNGIWFFENETGDTRSNRYPIFRPARRLSETRHYVMPSYTADGLRVLTPGFEHPGFLEQGLERRTKLPVDTRFYQPIGKQVKGPKVRHRQWRYCDYDGDGALDLIVGIEDWSEYGWDDAWDDEGKWRNGPLHGFVFLFRNEGTTANPAYAVPEQLTAAGRPIDVYGCPTPNFEDFDGDGDLDLFVAGRVIPAAYPVPATSRLYLNDGGQFVLDDANGATFESIGLVSAAVFSDLDADGDPDLVLALEWGPLLLLFNQGGRFTPADETWGLASHRSRWNGVTTGDIDGDGRLDIIATSWGRNVAHRLDTH